MLPISRWVRYVLSCGCFVVSALQQMIIGILRRLRDAMLYFGEGNPNVELSRYFMALILLIDSSS